MILYIDPGTGGVIINFLIAIVTSIIYFFRKLFFKRVNFDLIKKSEISIFSEGNQYKNTFLPIVNELIERKIRFNYYTLDYEDHILELESEFINSKFLGLGFLGKLKFSSISSNLLISTTPNIGNKGFPLKRPRKVRELIHVWHSISDISYYKKGSLDNYDTILTIGDFQNKSIKDIEKIRKLKSKKLIPVGLPYLDVFYENLKKLKNDKEYILIASSWGEKGLLNKYGYKILEYLKNNFLIIRPHPQSFISEIEFINKFKEECLRYPNIVWDDSPDPLISFSKSKLLISDTSSIRYDYSFLTGKPVITLKINKSDLKDFEINDLSSSWDEKNEFKLGKIITENNLDSLKVEVEAISNNSLFFEKIIEFKNNTIFSGIKSTVNIVNYLISQNR
tara:strand:- start:2542 stop:3720 length:1179 start_codon:yes stop_codon:yes gene_type:complete